MVVQHNLTAMNSNRMLGLTSSSQAKSTEKLSSGYKINRAADDAAGLSISEKMRKQIRGLTQASANAQDGISAVQTAEGALNEVHDMLQRMNELAVKAANGTMSENDRSYVQNEIDQLVTEIDRVSETTKFNETYLLKGSGDKSKSVEASSLIDGKIQDAIIKGARGNIYSATVDDSDPDKNLGAGTEDTVTITYLDEDGNTRTKDVTFKTGADAKATAKNIADAINADSELSKVFKASSDKAGKLSVESKLDGNKTDATKNAVQSMKFLSMEDEGAATGVRGTILKDEKLTAAVGESADFDITKLQDGDTITIDGKTYTYDASKADEDANTFGTLGDLQKLLGDSYQVSLTVEAERTTTTKKSVFDNPDTPTYKWDDDSAEEVTDTVTVDVAKADWKDTDIADLATSITAGKYTDLADVAATPTNATALGQTQVAVDVADQDDWKYVLSIARVEDVDISDTMTLSLHVGADSTEENQISVDIEAMSARGLGINGLRVDGEDDTNALSAIDTIAEAIQKVSTQRSALGAVQNRLEHTISNLDNVVENTTSAESRIRDTDMATEMVKYSNNNILAQAGQAMLAQANQANQGVLSLLG